MCSSWISYSGWGGPGSPPRWVPLQVWCGHSSTRRLWCDTVRRSQWEERQQPEETVRHRNSFSPFCGENPSLHLKVVRKKRFLTVGAGATYSAQPSLLGPWDAVTPSRQQPWL